MALLAQYQNLATEVRRMQVADIAVRPGLRSGELHGHLGFGLDDLFNPNICDFKAMGVIQLIDERELHFLPLVHHQALGQPDLGPVENRVNQGKLLRFSCCGIFGTKHQYGKKHNEHAEWSAPPMDLSHGDFSFAAPRAAACDASAP
jgi:hypothetical protein